MKEKRSDSKNQEPSPKLDPQKYLSAGRTVFLDGDARKSAGDDRFGLPSTAGYDPNAATLGSDIACVNS